MNRHILIAALALVIMLPLLSGCTPPVRYSPSELDAFPTDVQRHIINGEIALGMSPSAVRYAWGPPNDVRFPELEPGEVRAGKVEEWIYLRYRMFVTRLVFTDGKLTGIVSGVAKRKPLREPRPSDGQEQQPPKNNAGSPGGG